MPNARRMSADHAQYLDVEAFSSGHVSAPA